MEGIIDLIVGMAMIYALFAAAAVFITIIGTVTMTVWNTLENLIIRR